MARPKDKTPKRNLHLYIPMDLYKRACVAARRGKHKAFTDIVVRALELYVEAYQ